MQGMWLFLRSALLLALVMSSGWAAPYSLQSSPDSQLLVVVGPSLRQLEDVQQRPQALKTLTRQLYAQFRDEADFLLLVANRRIIPPETRVLGYQYRVSNAVKGIGVPVFNAGAEFGGTRNLQGILYFPRWYAFWRAPFLHEFAHQWANDALTTTEPGHFGFCSAGSQLGGFTTLRRLEGGTYQGFNAAGRPFSTAANGENSVPYSDFELYLMGFKSAAQVRPFQCAQNPRWVSLTRGTFSAGRLNTVRLGDIVKQNGPRLPDVKSSPRTFRILAVLVSETQPTPAEVRLAEHNLRGITVTDNQDSSYTFWEATGGLGRLELLWPARLRRP